MNVTIFTPTYNREKLLDRLYLSLLQQTDRNFEWLIVDDGSTDGTEQYFESILKNDNPFAIIYKKQENGGKHRAINSGVKMAHGELFFIVDSDDYLLPDAIEKIRQWRSTLNHSKKWAGVAGLRGYTKDTCVGGRYGKQAYVDATNLERDKYSLFGDKAEAYFTEVLAQYPFPEFPGEKFITEEVVWNAIAADGYKLRWFNDIIYICDYLDGGLTKSGNAKYIDSPNGTLLWAKQTISLFPKNRRRKISAIYRYYVAVNGRKTENEIAFDLGISRLKLRLIRFAYKMRKIIKK